MIIGDVIQIGDYQMKIINILTDEDGVTIISFLPVKANSLNNPKGVWGN
ncbi:hypothetical protein [Bacillus sp. 1NLA3E]|nr:hypothetical protein [Bacillus sp. 1NLA3E]